MDTSVKEKKNESWVATSCNACFNICAIRVHQKDGKVVDITGDPAVASSKGKICGKGKSRLADLYNPERVTTPLRRRNPEKGIGVDPQWEEISWEEAMDIVVSKLKKVRDEDPRKLVILNFDLCNFHIAQAFSKAYGTPNDQFYNVSCGNGLHTTFFLTLGTINSEIDLDYCNHIVLWGSQLGHGVNNNPLEAIAGMADARRRGAKLVVIDPVCGVAAAKADEWIPIRPGTDAALALGMLNVLLNELGLYDAEFLKNKTNAPYLIDGSGRYVRDAESRKPMVWDALKQRAAVYDADDIGDFALEGSYEVAGKSCRPSFDLLKEHVRKHYPLEKVAEISTVPAETIRRLAKEFGEAARIGSTMQMEGQTLPYRPAAVEFKRGVTHHKNGFFNVFSLQLLNIVVGNLNTPGGLLGTNPHGPVELWKMFKGRDGHLTSNMYYNLIQGYDSFACFMSPYPPNEVKAPESLNLRGLFPLSGFLPGIPCFSILEPEKFGIPYKPDTMIICRTNPMIGQNDPKKLAEMFRKLDFILGFGIKIDETLEFADIILPEAHDLERYWFLPANQPAGFQRPGPGDWYFQTVQPVVDPPPGVRSWLDVMIELGDRLGILPELNAELNNVTMLHMMEPLKLDPNTRYDMKEINNRQGKLFSMLAGDTSDEIFTPEKPVVNMGKKQLHECYSTPFTDARVPIYLEHLLDVGEEVKRVTRELGMDWWDVSHYQPLADWRPCPAYEDTSEEYDLFVSSSRLPLHNYSISADNPWVDDVSTHSRLDYHILLNTATAKRKGICDGDTVCVASRTGTVKGKVRVTECVHPEVVATLGGHFGQWARQKKIAKGKGINHNALLALDWNMVGTLTGQLDSCAKVKIYKEK